MKSSIRIPLIYTLIGSLWVAVSSLYLEAFQGKIGVEDTTVLEVVKAVLFVVFSGWLIYFLIDRALLRERKLWSSYISIFNNSPVYMWMVQKKDGNIYATNHIAERNFGIKSKDNKVVKFDDLVPLKMREKERLFGDKNYQINNRKLRDNSGRERTVDIYSVPFTRGKENLIMITAIDNTDLNRSLHEKIKLNANLLRQNAQLKEFSFMNSHHLRRPLSNIMGIINLLDDQEKSKTENIRMLKESSDQLDVEIRKMNEIISMSYLQPEMAEEHQPPRFRSILIVDDDRVQQMINKRLFLKSNPDLDLQFFENPEEALNWLQQNTVDMILLDINMPEMSGWEFLDRMKEMGVQIEVKMLSSSIDPEDEEKSKQYKVVSGFLVKPLKKEALAEIIRA